MRVEFGPLMPDHYGERILARNTMMGVLKVKEARYRRRYVRVRTSTPRRITTLTSDRLASDLSAL